MTDLPFMPMFWSDFFADVSELPGETQGVYAVLLGRMWIRGGWVPADDRFIARLIGIDVRAWRARHKAAIVPLLRQEILPLVGESYGQKRLTLELAKAREVIAKNKARTAAATAARLKKSKAQANVTKGNGHDRDVDRNVDRSDHVPARVPEPHEPPSTGEGGSGPLTPGPPEPARSPAAGSSSLAGPFVPGQRLPPTPKQPTKFLQDWEAAGGDISKLPKREGLPPPTISERAHQGLWDRVQQRFDPPGHGPPEDPELVKRLIDEGTTPKEEPPDERAADQPRNPDDDIDDFLKF